MVAPSSALRFTTASTAPQIGMSTSYCCAMAITAAAEKRPSTTPLVSQGQGVPPMNFVLYCVDKAGHGHLRTENRPAHIDYLKANLAKIVLAGPMTSEDGEKPIGSVIIIEAADRAEAEAFAAGDPYAKAGVFESVTIKPFKKVLP